MISDLILIAKKFSVPSGYGRRDGVRDFFAQYPDGVYIATDAGAPAGWEGYAVWFGGAGERYAERFMEFIRDGYIVERFLLARVGGLLVFTFRCRLKMRRFGTLGKPHGKPDALNFYMPNGGTISLNKTGSPTVVELEYSLDEGATWTVWPEDGSGNRSLTLTAGQRIYVRNTSETSTGFSTTIDDYYTFGFNNDVYADGLTMSLVSKYPENAQFSSYMFRLLFYQCSTLKSAPILSEGSAPYCYISMFNGCTSLLTAPELKGNTISSYACNYMFYNCRALTNVPDLKATTVLSYGYGNMFDGCISLVSAPNISCLSLSSYSMYRMFRNCNSLVNPPTALYAKTAQSACYREMFIGCNNMTSAPAIHVTQTAQDCFIRMFYGCNKLSGLISLQFTSFTGNYVCVDMFRECHLLNNLRVSFTSISGTDQLNNWLDNVAATGDFYCPAELTIPTGASGIPSGWTRHNI